MFEFEQQVAVRRASADGKVAPGDVGVIVGRSNEECGEIEYGVFIERLKRVYAFVDRDLESLDGSA